MNGDDSRSFSGLLDRVVGDVQGIIRSEVQLAKTEIREETVRAGRAGGMLGAGALLGIYALGFLLLACLYALEIAVTPWLAAMILAVVIGAAALILAGSGWKRLKRVDPKPEKTVQTIKDNIAWAKNQTR